MPLLDLPSLHLPEAAPYLIAVMFYPRDFERRQRFLKMLTNTAVGEFVLTHKPNLREFIGDRKRSGAQLNKIIEMVLDAAEGPKFGDLTQSEIDEIFDKRGVGRHWTAGILLYHVICSSAFQETKPKASLENAIRAVTTAGGSRRSVFGRSRSTVLKCWSDFAPSAHLSAATIFFPDVWESAIRDRGMSLAKFLAVSEALRVVGERHRSPRSKSSLLNPGETWKAPPELSLPEVTLNLLTPSAIEGGLCQD